MANVEIQCTTVAASGSGHHWQVVVDAQHSNSSAITMSFAKDNMTVVIAAIAGPGGILLIAAILVCCVTSIFCICICICICAYSAVVAPRSGAGSRAARAATAR